MGKVRWLCRKANNTLRADDGDMDVTTVECIFCAMSSFCRHPNIYLTLMDLSLDTYSYVKATP